MNPIQINNVLTDQERKILLEYLAYNDDRTDVRPDVRSKHPLWNQGSWPQHIIQQALEWNLGSAIVFDREQVHCSGSTHSKKVFLTCFLHEKV